MAFAEREVFEVGQPLRHHRGGIRNYVSLKRQRLPGRQLLKQNCLCLNSSRTRGQVANALGLESEILTCKKKPLDIGQFSHLSYSRKCVIVLILQIIRAASMKVLTSDVRLLSTINMAFQDVRFPQRRLWRMVYSAVWPAERQPTFCTSARCSFFVAYFSNLRIEAKCS
jgi:hypothetical protein